MDTIKNKFNSYRLIFWDFDGVIKDSVDIKTGAYCKLFQNASVEVLEKIKRHHLVNGGISRYEKIPLYLEWSGRSLDLLEEFIQNFESLVVQTVISSDWIPGVEEIIRNNPYKQKFILVTGTPQSEIELILKELKISNSFEDIYGAPFAKDIAIAISLTKFAIEKGDALLVGDSESDWKAATKNGINFLLRNDDLGIEFVSKYTGDRIKDFTELDLNIK
ncbi:HAD family hydrolase [Leptospira biflexa]|uniref:HAD family hydrolase n=1 Tax=Leptospira biflexa TaxID=172 RepID=UPI001082EA19|nr:HAD hydrolase-like protein [Leptospira biflexa]TGM31729.1 HAD family hydrolase [Leptospira biflexa]TGM39112.1 HAD family hydrolase [Leptospira biflexa]